MCKVKPPIAERHDVVVWEEMEIINKFNYFLSYPIFYSIHISFAISQSLWYNTYIGIEREK